MDYFLIYSTPRQGRCWIKGHQTISFVQWFDRRQSTFFFDDTVYSIAAVLFVDGSCVADVCTRHYRLDCQGSDREDLKSNLWARYSPVSAALWRLALFKMLPCFHCRRLQPQQL